MEGIKWTSRATLRLSGRPNLYNVMYVMCQVKNLGEIRLVAEYILLVSLFTWRSLAVLFVHRTSLPACIVFEDVAKRY